MDQLRVLSKEHGSLNQALRDCDRQMKIIDDSTPRVRQIINDAIARERNILPVAGYRDAYLVSELRLMGFVFEVDVFDKKAVGLRTALEEGGITIARKPALPYKDLNSSTSVLVERLKRLDSYLYKPLNIDSEKLFIYRRQVRYEVFQRVLSKNFKLKLELMLMLMLREDQDQERANEENAGTLALAGEEQENESREKQPDAEFRAMDGLDDDKAKASWHFGSWICFNG